MNTLALNGLGEPVLYSHPSLFQDHVADSSFSLVFR
jgi:hypothetical protein